MRFGATSVDDPDFLGPAGIGRGLTRGLPQLPSTVGIGAGKGRPGTRFGLYSGIGTGVPRGLTMRDCDGVAFFFAGIITYPFQQCDLNVK